MEDWPLVSNLTEVRPARRQGSSRTAGALKSTYSGGGDAFVTKLNATGSSLVYLTYLGGSGLDEGFGIALDSGDDAYVVGKTFSADFPTMSPLQLSNGGGQDAFAAELNSAGSLIYSTYLGGTGYDQANSVAVDPSGDAYVTGYTTSSNFPTLNALQTTCKSCPNEEDFFFVTVLVVAPWSTGDVHPNVGLALALCRRGHRAVLVAAAVFEALARGVGLLLVGFGTEEEYYQTLRDPGLWHPYMSFPLVARRLMLPLMRQMYDLIAGHYKSGDLAVAASGLVLGSRLAQEKLGVPLATVHLQYPPQVRGSFRALPRLGLQ